MIILITFAFIAGIVTILSPCILPILPIILSSGIGSGEESKKRPLGIVTGFILSFTFFTLFLSTLVKATHIPGDSLRSISVIVIGLFGISLLIPAVQTKLEQLFGTLSSHMPQSQNKTGFVGGILVGASLGLLWTPCVGPILASVITLASTGDVSSQAFYITLAYSIGTAIPMLAIMFGGRALLQKVPWLVQNTAKIQKAFGIIMIITAIGIALNLDRRFQTYILEKFPNYGTGLTKIEDNDLVKVLLNDIETTQSNVLTKPTRKTPELILGGEWINSEPLTLSELKGKVVLIDFWTYSCINCQRTFPYLRTWWEKYQDHGLVIIGVHAPEFEFEKNIQNVIQATKDFDLMYPIMQDNNFATWRAYQNHYWPAKYLIDTNGYIRYTHFGEGDYDKTEMAIQDLLKEAGYSFSDQSINNPSYTTEAQTPELYLGNNRLSALVSPEKITPNQSQQFSKPSSVKANHFAYEGTWTVFDEYAQPQEGASLYLTFTAKDVFLVMNPEDGTTGSVAVYLDGQKTDTITVDSDRLYHLVSLEQAGQHLLQLQFNDAHTKLFAFTFG